MQDNKTRAITKTIRLEKDLHDKIVEMGRANERDFSAQLRFIGHFPGISAAGKNTHTANAPNTHTVSSSFETSIKLPSFQRP